MEAFKGRGLPRSADLPGEQIGGKKRKRDANWKSKAWPGELGTTMRDGVGRSGSTGLNKGPGKGTGSGKQLQASAGATAAARLN